MPMELTMEVRRGRGQGKKNTGTRRKENEGGRKMHMESRS